MRVPDLHLAWFLLIAVAVMASVAIAGLSPIFFNPQEGERSVVTTSARAPRLIGTIIRSATAARIISVDNYSWPDGTLPFVDSGTAPSWTRLRTSTGETGWVVEEAHGWPFLAFRCKFTPALGAGMEPAVVGGFVTGSFWSERAWVGVTRVIPTTPIWLGLLGDVIFWTIVIWFLHWLAHKTRCFLRRRDDRCERCGYPLCYLRSPNCPECGFARVGVKPGIWGNRITLM
jgi:hypothetical protein